MRRARKTTVELILSNHPQDCLVCLRNQNCELQTLSRDLGITEVRYTGRMTDVDKDQSSPSIVRDPNKCVLCRRCIAVCSQIQGVDILGAAGRGFDTVVAPLGRQRLVPRLVPTVASVS